MASKLSLRRYGKYALVLCGAGISSYAVYRLIDQKKEVHFYKKKSKPNVKLKLLDVKVSHCLIYCYVLQTYLVKASSQPSALPKPITGKGLPSRADQLKKLSEGKEYDVLVIGGGATGCGVALDSITRGM